MDRWWRRCAPGIGHSRVTARRREGVHRCSGRPDRTMVCIVMYTLQESGRDVATHVTVCLSINILLLIVDVCIPVPFPTNSSVIK